MKIKISTAEEIARSGTSFLGRLIFSTHKVMLLRIKTLCWDSWRDGFTKGYAKGFEAAEKSRREAIQTGGIYELMKKNYDQKQN